jgi:pyruvate-formate lyase-activating enzyme
MDKEIKSIGFALDPAGAPAFLLDWELTKLCNLDCSYCGVGIDGGHDNSTKHPLFEECIKSIDFMYAYVDLYMQQKKSTQRKVVLNVYGGESLFHPDIIKILTACHEKYQKYSDLWHLTITTTTNAVINKSIWREIIPLIDEFTVSYHAENLPKQERLFFQNLLELKNQNKRVKCVVMMHNSLTLWEKSISAIKFCQSNNIRYIAKPFDNSNLEYTAEQFNYMKDFWIDTTLSNNVSNSIEQLKSVKTSDKVVSLCKGRACCGGRKLAVNNDLKSSVTFVTKQGFYGWYCSVNWFFLFVQQVTGNIYSNKDCRMSLNNKVEPIGNINNFEEILQTLRDQFNTKSMPVIQCAKQTCMCGYCAPKAEKLDDFKELIKRNVITDVIKFN